MLDTCMKSKTSKVDDIKRTRSRKSHLLFHGVKLKCTHVTENNQDSQHGRVCLRTVSDRIYHLRVYFALVGAYGCVSIMDLSW
jgi:hypothetical protein